ncbi:hypothetical protein [Defluviimonas denitrificans]|jgi:hypothetical protein|uniref:hypothetical protein n=1 Tax=Albidovulum denitrificans TaxID=404881 RepID=UPI0011B00E5D|nr:hypothetical protein [Defluviimonas denitrificans]
MTEDIFPESDDDGCEPFRSIAAHVHCSEDDVFAAFAGLPVPEWITPTHLQSVRAATQRWNEAARHARNLQHTLMRLTDHERVQLRVAGAVTVEQIAHLQSVLDGDAKNLNEWLTSQPRAGRENIAAAAVAEGIRRLFRRRRKRITFGQHPEGGPSTEFGRAVEFSIGAFGVLADWRRPAQKAKEKQDDIQGRLMSIHMAAINRTKG